MLFDSTLRKELVRSFAATLVVVLTIVLTILLIRMLGQAAGGRVSPQDVALLMGFTAVGHLPTMLNLALFVAVVSTLTRLYRDSEMAVWMVSGVSLLQVVRAMARPCILVVASTAALVLVVWPWTNRQIVELRDRYDQRSDLSRVAPGQFQTSGNGRRVFFIDNQSQPPGLAAPGSAAAPASAASAQGVGRNVFVLDNTGTRESITTAEAGRLDTDAQGRRTLVLSHGTRADLDVVSGNKTVSQFTEQSLLVSERAAARLDEAPPKVHDSLTLLHSELPGLRGELVWRIGLALCGINLVLLGAGLAAGGPRRQAGSWTLLLALLGFMVYTNLINLSQAWVVAGRQSVWSALLMVHGSAALIGLTLLWWRDSGAARFALRRG
jgi:lipopolysaccharide export system permease protein